MMSPEQIACLKAVAAAGGCLNHESTTLDAFCDDGSAPDTFNQCHDAGWLSSSHGSVIADDDSHVYLTDAGRAALADARAEKLVRTTALALGLIVAVIAGQVHAGEAIRGPRVREDIDAYGAVCSPREMDDITTHGGPWATVSAGASQARGFMISDARQLCFDRNLRDGIRVRGFAGASVDVSMSVIDDTDAPHVFIARISPTGDVVVQPVGDRQ